MKIYKADTSWRTGNPIITEYNAADAIKRSLYEGSESNQLTTLQKLVALMAERLLEAELLSLADLVNVEALDYSYVLNREDVDLETDD
jgi:hypothetical protein